MAIDNTTIDIELTGAIIQNNNKQPVSGTNYKLFSAQHFASPYNMVQGSFNFTTETSFMVKMNVTKMQIFYPSTAGGYKEFTGPLPGFPSTVYPISVSKDNDFPSNTTITMKVSIPDDNTVSGVDSSKNWKVVIKMTPIAKPTVDLTGSVPNATIEPNTGFKTDGSTLYTLTFTASDGYRFKTDTDITEGGATKNNKWRFETAGKTSLVDTVTWDNGVTTLTVTGETEKIPTPKLIQQLTNVKSDFTAQTLDINKAYTINLTPDSGYEFTADDTGEIGYYDDAIGYSKISDVTRTDSTHAVVEFTCPNTSENITLYMSASPEKTKTVAVNNQLKHASMSLTDSTMTVGTPYNITFTADAGYEFTEAGYIGYYDSDGTWKQLSMIGIGDGQTSTIPITISSASMTPIIFSIEATEKETDTVELVTKLSNATLNFSDEIPDGKQTLTFTASSGYIFDTNGTISVLSRAGENTDTVITANGLSTLSVPFTVDSENTQTITIQLSASKKVVQPTTATVEYKLENATATPSPSIVNIGSTNAIKLTPNEHFRFNNNGSITQYAKDNSVITTTQITIEDSLEENTSYTVQTNTDHIVVSITAISNQSIGLNKNLANCHLDPDIETLEIGEQTLHLVAENDCIFDKQGEFYYYNNSGTIQTTTIVANNGTTLDVKVTIPNGAQIAYINMNATKQSVETSGGYANIYKTTPSEMNALSNEVLWTTSSNGNLEGINQNDFITNFYRLPLEIPTTELQSNVKFALGKYKSETNTNQVLHDILTYDLGTINITEKYKNAFDYQNTTCTLYTPFMPAITLKPQIVINKPFSIKYQIDMFTGNANINIYDSNNTVIYSNQNKISTDLPFLQVDTNKVGLRENNTFNNNILTAYVIVNRQIPNTLNNTYPTIEQGQLNNYKGNVIVKDIDLPDSIISTDKDKILSLLQKGVVIK